MKKLYPSLSKGLNTSHWHSLGTAILMGLFITFSSNAIAQEQCKQECDSNYFSAKLVSSLVVDNCTTYKLEVSVDKANKYALSHFVVEVPCGKVTEATNSGNWPIIKNATDPKSGIYGLKVDEINGFGDSHQNETFTLEYTVCGTCCDSVAPTSFDVVFKAATCQFVQTINIAAPAPVLLATIVPTPIQCNGANNGQATVQVTQGTAPYSYLWQTGDTTQTISGLAPGTYSVTVTDAKAKTVSLSTEIKEPSALTLSASVTPTACNAPTGVITINPTGGTAPYNYLWSNGQTTASIDSLAIGQYNVTIADANKCTLIKTYTIAQNTNLTATLATTALQCHQEGDGVINITVKGGTAPYAYNWSNGATTQNISELTTGRYEVTITDGQGCTTKQATYVTIRNLSATLTAKAPLCQGDSTGSASLTVLNGTAPYSFSWNNGDSTQTVNNLASGWYFVTITDVNGCTAQKAVNIPTPTPLNINYTTTRNSCDAGDTSVSVTLSGSGGTMPYTWLVDGSTSPTTFDAKAPTSYEISMTDANGCSTFAIADITYPNAQLTANATIKQPSCQNTTGSATVSATNGVQPVTAIWSDGFSGLTRTDLTPGEYTVLITDANGCTASTTVKIIAYTAPTVEIVTPTAQDICQTNGNTITAQTSNATNVQWTIESANNDWIIESSNQNILTYTAGTGTATITVVAFDAEGCSDSHSIVLNCQTNPTDPGDGGDNGDGDNGDGSGDGDNNGGGGTGGNNGECTMEDNYWAETIEITNNGCNSQEYAIRIHTDGLSEHELSHLIIGLGDATACEVNISENWSIEKNTTDPKSGVYGIKVDNINNFGQSGEDYFDVTFTICNTRDDDMPENFEIVYKAATCQWSKTIGGTVQHVVDDNINTCNYPNPFVDHTTIEVIADRSTDMKVHICDASGNRVETIYDGKVVEKTKYKFEFNAKGKCDRLFFYQIVTPKGTKHGKLIRK